MYSAKKLKNKVKNAQTIFSSKYLAKISPEAISRERNLDKGKSIRFAGC